MRGKLLELLDLADLGIDSMIFNAGIKGNIARALKGEYVGTRIGREKDHIQPQADHIRICMEKPVDAKEWPFQDLVLLHKALPEIDEADIDTSCIFLGKKLKAPFMISAMTGGHPDVKQINVRLGEAASELGIALGVGSQRAAIEDRRLVDTFSAVRDAAPDIPIIGNIGAVQLKRSGPEILERLAR
jgi:isopentenyl-diphosphate delta-isomerase